MAAFAVDRQSRRDILFVRIRVHFVKQGAAQARSVENVECVLRYRQRREAAVGHQQGIADMRGVAGIGEFRNAPGAEADGGGIGPVGGEHHGENLGRTAGFRSGQSPFAPKERRNGLRRRPAAGRVPAHADGMVGCRSGPRDREFSDGAPVMGISGKFWSSGTFLPGSRFDRSHPSGIAPALRRSGPPGSD